MTCKARKIAKLPASQTIRWFTPSHGLYVIGKDSKTGLIYASRIKEPAFHIEGDTQHLVEKAAGAIINLEFPNDPRTNRGRSRLP